MDQDLELWGGAECTINRVGDRFFNQREASGSADRLDDLDRIAGLGIRTLRFPILWEEISPQEPGSFAWARSDAWMARLSELNIRPIVGLLHHGSGPRYTDLLDPDFPELLAAFALAVAQRYPRVQDWTPINEPLTTARFSGLYGHWYPHGRDPETFARTFLTQIRGIGAAMRAIRTVTPQARLIQTEDLGETLCSPRLEYQAAFENERRWLTYDLLAGKLHPDGPIEHYLRQAGIARDELRAWADEPCPPDVLGINHYVTSSRFLNGEIEGIPPEHCGFNGREHYVDQEAVRTAPDGMPEPIRLLRAAWSRYGIPLAVTEAHLSCTREEQVRWLSEIWRAAKALRHEQVPCIAVTAWALFGAYDWDSLLTRQHGRYEPGAYDLRSVPPRRTAVARMIQELARDGQTSDSLALQPGWWRREARFLDRGEEEPVEESFVPLVAAGEPLLILSRGGGLGDALARLCRLRGLNYRLIADCSFTPGAVVAAVQAHRPWAVIHAAEEPADVEIEMGRPLSSTRVTGDATSLARVCADEGLPLLMFSSDLVFGGDLEMPSFESDSAEPRTAIGRQWKTAETFVLKSCPGALIVRHGPLFGPWDNEHFLTQTLANLGRGNAVQAPADIHFSPTYLPDLVHAALDLLIDQEQGVWHLANTGVVSWYEFARAAAHRSGVVAPIDSLANRESTGARARPPWVEMKSERAQLLPSWEDALGRYFAKRQLAQASALRGDAVTALRATNNSAHVLAAR